MTFRLSLAFALYLLLSGTPLNCAATDAPQVTIEDEKREKCSEGAMLEMNLCMSAERKESDARLNFVYRALMNALKDSGPLQRTQRTWIAFRDLECGFQTDAYRTGTAHPYALNICLIHLTEQRIADLEKVMPCNGCVEFKEEYYRAKDYRLPPRNWQRPKKVK